MLSDSESVVDILSTYLVASLGLQLHEVQSDSYGLTASNRQSIKVKYETSFIMFLSHQRTKLQMVCLVSTNISSEDIITSWATMAKLGIFLLLNESHQVSATPSIYSLDNNTDIPVANKTVMNVKSHILKLHL